MPSEMYIEPAAVVWPPNTVYLPSGVRAMSAPNFVVWMICGTVGFVISNAAHGRVPLQLP